MAFCIIFFIDDEHCISLLVFYIRTSMVATEKPEAFHIPNDANEESIDYEDLDICDPSTDITPVAVTLEIPTLEILTPEIVASEILTPKGQPNLTLICTIFFIQVPTLQTLCVVYLQVTLWASR